MHQRGSKLKTIFGSLCTNVDQSWKLSSVCTNVDQSWKLSSVCTNVDQSWSRINKSWIKQTT